MKTSNNGNEAERMWKCGQIHSNVMKRNNYLRNGMKTSNNGNEAERMWKCGQIHSNVMKRYNYLMILY